jgi:hypothetical protein
MDKFCLIHIPKTAGVSLWMFLMDDVYENYADHFNDYDWEDVDLTEIVKKDLIVGHIDYNDIVKLLSPEHRVATILREPVSRCISWYKYSSLISNDGINEENKALPLRDVHLSTHRLNKMYIHNTMTWQLGDHLDPTRRTKSPEEALEIAKLRINTMDDVLFFSHFQDCVAKLALKYKWDVNLHQMPWVNPTVWIKPEVTDEAVRNLLSVNKLDTELYNYALKSRKWRGEL